MQLSKLSLRLFALQALLAIGVVAVPGSAEAQRRPGPRGPQAPQQVTTEHATLNSYLDRRDKINVLRALKVEQDLMAGKKLVSLSVSASSNEYNAKLVLKLNGQKIDTVKVGPYGAQKRLQVPPNLAPHDKLVLSPTESVYVSTLTASLESVYQPPRQPGQVLRARVEQVTRGREVLRVLQLVKSQNGPLRGTKVDKVILKANSLGRGNGPRSMAQAQLLINGMPVGYPQTLPKMMGRIIFDLPNYAQNVIGQDLRSAQIQITGKAQVQMVGLKKAQRHFSRPVQVNVNKTFYGSQRVTLESLIGRILGRNSMAPIEALTITAKGAGSIMVTGYRGMMGSMTVGSVFGQSETMAPYVHTKVSDVKMRVSGRITIESIRIKFK